jgi:hypothetical protein
MSFLTREKSAWDVIGSPPECHFLTRKKWRDRATPLGASTDSARGPVHPALGIFGGRKSTVPRGSTAETGLALSEAGRGGKGTAVPK